MAVTLRASVTYENVSNQTVFAFNFDYLRQSFVHVVVNGVEVDNYVITATQLEFSVAPTGTVRIYRKTPTDRLVNWSEGSYFKATDLTVNQVQTIHILEETLDSIFSDNMSKNANGQWDGQGKRITNVQSPVDDGDVVTKAYLKAYASIGGDTGLDPETIAQMLSDVVAQGEAITAIELGMTTLQGSIPTNTSQLTNDSNFVVDANYVHTDNNYDNQTKQKIDTLKELQRVEFSDTSAEWSGTEGAYVFTYPTTENTLVAMFRKTGSTYKIDTTTDCSMVGTDIVINTTTKFSGYLILTGTVAYGNLEELLGLILNEQTEHTWTLEEIIGATYREAATPTQEQLDASISAFTSLMNNAVNNCNSILTSAQILKAQCADYYNLMTTYDFADYMPSADIVATYLPKADAESLYLSKTAASTTYAPIASVVTLESVAELPASPVATTWYFIQEVV